MNYFLPCFIIAWAHLILYGEEATRVAQKEGEEAAAAYEQEKRDIAAGKIPEPLAKPEKKKKAPAKKSKKEKAGGDDAAVPKKRKYSPAQSNGPEKRPRQTKQQQEKEALAPTLAKAVAKVRCICRSEFSTERTRCLNYFFLQCRFPCLHLTKLLNLWEIWI